jgi:hypothetical protein
LPPPPRPTHGNSAYPQKFFNSTWTPWRGSRTPSCNAGGSNAYCLPAPAPTPPTPPTPQPAGKPEGNLDGVARSGGKCAINGWCSGPEFSGPALQVRVLLDHAALANGTASAHRAKAGNHGFDVGVDCAAFAAGTHRFDVQCFYPPTEQWFGLNESPMCTKGGTRAAC